MTVLPSRRSNPAAAFIVSACFLTAPFVAFLAHNARDAVDAWSVLRWPAAGLVPVAMALGAIWLAAGRAGAERAAVVLAALLVGFFNYGALSDGLATVGVPPAARLLVWGIGAILLAGLGFAWSRKRSAIQFLSIAGIFLVAIPLAQYIAAAGFDAPPTASIEPRGHPSFERTPDIYYIVPDAYARADLLADEFGFDNSPFLDALRDRGFHVVDDALTHYPVTYLSVASTLDMDYVVEPGESALRDGRQPFYDRLRGSSALHRRLEIEGYRHVSAPPGTWLGTECSGAEDLCVEPISRRWLGGLLGEVEWELAHLTPAGEFIDAFLTDSFADHSLNPRTWCGRSTKLSWMRQRSSKST